MSQIVSDHLTFSRPLDRLQLARVLLGELAASVVAALQGRAECAGVELRCTGDALTVADAQRVKEALFNLVANGIEACAPDALVSMEFAQGYAERFHMDDVRLSPALVEKLARASWPGNVRQLENCVARLVALGGGAEIGAEAFDDTPLTAGRGEAAAAPSGTPKASASLKEQVDAFERTLVSRVLAASAGNQSEAARRLRISRSALIDRVRKYNLS
jgi:hypothetical protein